MQRPADESSYPKASYSDDLLFDKLRPMLPNPRQGRNVVLLSFALQAGLVVLGFVGHHHRKSDFTCCNMWALLVAVLFIAIQWPYYSDWCSKFGAMSQWHRANIFAPFIIFCIIFVFWNAGFVSLVAHADGQEFFNFSAQGWNPTEMASFILCTICLFFALWLLAASAHTHRNNLGPYYYTPKDSETALTTLTQRATPTEGSFNYRNMLGLMSQVLSIETTIKAEQNFTRVIMWAAVLEIVFYVFAILVFTVNKSILLILFAALGLSTLLINFSSGYAYGAVTEGVRITRIWNRAHLFYPMTQCTLLVVVYTYVFAAVFFKPVGGEASWESLVSNAKLDSTELGLFSSSLILLIAFGCVQYLLALLHRKAWAEGTDDVLDQADDVMEEEVQRMRDRKRKQAKQQNYDIEMSPRNGAQVNQRAAPTSTRAPDGMRLPIPNETFAGATARMQSVRVERVNEADMADFAGDEDSDDDDHGHAEHKSRNDDDDDGIVQVKGGRA